MFWRTWQWSAFVAVCVIVLSATSAYFILEKEAQLDASVKHFMSTPTDNVVWGAEQFRIELARMRAKVSAYGDAYISYDPSTARTASDILYSRFETLSFSLHNLNDNFKRDLMAPSTYDALRQNYLELDTQLNQFFANPAPEHYGNLLNYIDKTDVSAAIFASEILYASQQHAHELRIDMLARAHDYKAALLLMLVGSMVFIAVIWLVNWKITEINKKLERAVKNADEAAHAKAQFLSSMSHEFRTPLNAISGYVQLILMKFSPDHREEISSYEQAIDQSVFYLVDLVDQVLELDHLIHRDESIIIDRIDVKVMIKNAVKLSARSAISKQISIHQGFGDEPYELETDSGMLMQVISCLISNAIKYNHDDGDVWIGCTEKRDSVTITIEDNGIGIPKDKEKLLFSPFERLGREAGAISGSGTGLSISQQICTQLGMEVAYERSRTGGCVFKLDAPRRYIPPKYRMGAPNTFIAKPLTEIPSQARTV